MRVSFVSVALAILLLGALPTAPAQQPEPSAAAAPVDNTVTIPDDPNDVVIQVAPRLLPPPFRGEHARVDMNRKPGLVRVQLMRGNTEVPLIEQHRIMSVINPADYPVNQRELLYSGLAIYNPNDVLAGGNLELRIYHGGREPFRLPIPAPVVERIRADLASVIR